MDRNSKSFLLSKISPLFGCLDAWMGEAKFVSMRRKHTSSKDVFSKLVLGFFFFISFFPGVE